MRFSIHGPCKIQKKAIKNSDLKGKRREQQAKKNKMMGLPC
jgi:hypothetical protein